MIEHVTGNILESDAMALVNPVNTVGVMGKGLAKQFKAAYPQAYTAYASACKSGELQIGTIHWHSIGGAKWLVNFPTKQHWRSLSKLEYIQQGLVALLQWVQEFNVSSVAMPLLGCGLGGLNKEDVVPLIETAFDALPNVSVRLYSLEVVT